MFVYTQFLFSRLAEEEMKKVLRRNDPSIRNSTVRTVRYVECQKNHAASVGRYVVDELPEYMPQATTDTLNCATCGCHRQLPQKVKPDSTSTSSTTT
ncbi:hypothetical protein HAX54_032453 [Datura stramonium]|uniref:ZF-HD dimerization-type domain-containing protein n=1 Tax=Datura stramonium TaxID=4076 RepID=A0ABS8VD89_DATST|nr:hypothetical protein [Datura stramonium]